jgi:hypothetical protein
MLRGFVCCNGLLAATERKLLAVCSDPQRVGIRRTLRDALFTPTSTIAGRISIRRRKLTRHSESALNVRVLSRKTREPSSVPASHARAIAMAESDEIARAAVSGALAIDRDGCVEPCESAKHGQDPSTIRNKKVLTV